MKKFDIFKTIQLIIFVLLTGIALYIIFTDHELYRLIASNPHIRCCVSYYGQRAASLSSLFSLTLLYILRSRKITRNWTMRYPPTRLQESPTASAVML